MKMSWKQKVAKATGPNRKLNSKALRIKKSWDEVEKILNDAAKPISKSRKKR